MAAQCTLELFGKCMLEEDVKLQTIAQQFYVASERERKSRRLESQLVHPPEKEIPWWQGGSGNQEIATHQSMVSNAAPFVNSGQGIEEAQKTHAAHTKQMLSNT